MNVTVKVWIRSGLVFPHRQVYAPFEQSFILDVTQEHCTYFRTGLVWLKQSCIWLTVFLLAGCASSIDISHGSSVTNGPTVTAKRVLPRIGLALGGGAARGFAHIGVIQVLEEAGIRPSMLAGTSAGSLVAAIYASGKTGAQLQKLAHTMDEATIADWTLPLFGRGILRGEALARYVNVQVGSRLIENMSLPLGIVATDLNSGEAVVFRRGDTGTAVRASSAVPAVFQPVQISGREYVDGGLVSPVPVRAVRAMGAELVIAVDISSAPESSAANGAVEMVLQTFSIMGKSLNTFELKDADVVVRPALRDISSADFSARKLSIEAGRKAMLSVLPQLQAMIAAKSR